MRTMGLLALSTLALTLATDSASVQASPGRAAERALLRVPGMRLARHPTERRLVEALRTQQHEEAAELARRALAGARGWHAMRLSWLLARATDDEDEALRLWGRVAQSRSPLAPWACLQRAEGLAGSEPTAALKALARLPSAWAGQPRAQRARALALKAAGRTDEAKQALKRLLARGAGHVPAELTLALAELLAAETAPASRERALELYRHVATRAPLSDEGELAEQRAEEVLATLPADRRQQLAELPVEDAFARGLALYDARAYEDAEAHFAQLSERFAGDEQLACRARLQQGRAMLRQKKREQGAPLMAKLADECSAPGIKAWARYYGGRAYVRIAEPERAIELYEALQAEADGNSLADDALFKAALAALDAGDEEGMRERLARVPQRYPNGDMRLRAGFALAWHHYKRNELDAALKHFEALLAGPVQERSEGARGRAEYWRARTLERLGRQKAAKQAYRELIQTFPLSYHAQQALARLSKLDPALRERLMAAWREQGHHVLQFQKRKELRAPAFRRALELLKVGEFDLADHELDWMGATGESADKDMLWLIAGLLHHYGAYADATRLVKRRLDHFLEYPPVKKARAMWRIAYPDAYEPLIDETAKRFEVPASFVRAVAREESAFNPRAVSVARAYGLIQLIRPTAKAHADELGLPSDPESLMQPEINLPIGTHFIQQLWSRYEDNPAVVPAAYNAGFAAVDRWLRARPDQPLDEWIESIPYGETRRYTRRVLQSYGTYRWLESGKLPELSEKLPVR